MTDIVLKCSSGGGNTGGGSTSTGDDDWLVYRDGNIYKDNITYMARDFGAYVSAAVGCSTLLRRLFLNRTLSSSANVGGGSSVDLRVWVPLYGAEAAVFTSIAPTWVEAYMASNPDKYSAETVEAFERAIQNIVESKDNPKVNGGTHSYTLYGVHKNRVNGWEWVEEYNSTVGKSYLTLSNLGWGTIKVFNFATAVGSRAGCPIVDPFADTFTYKQTGERVSDISGCEFVRALPQRKIEFHDEDIKEFCLGFARGVNDDDVAIVGTLGVPKWYEASVCGYNSKY